MARTERHLLVATESFTGALNGEIFSAAKDRTRIWSDHPAAKRWPQHFKELFATHSAAVEQATAAPGEQRGD
jgi:hypothetical protein